MSVSAKTIVTAGTVFSALSGMAYGAWEFGDYTGIRPVILREFKLALTQEQQNTLATIQLEFKYLQDKMKFGELSFEEKQARCKDAQILGFSAVDGCLLTTGEPVFIQKSIVK